jgi:cupin fold WbuC family metalloprotein
MYEKVLVNTWIEGSYSPVHKHPIYSESFVVLEGALAFFVFSENNTPVCHILSSNGMSTKKAIIVEANEWHAMTAAPQKLGTLCN